MHAGVEQSVLTAVVFSQAVAMSPAVILDPESLAFVVEIRAANETARSVVNRSLRLWAGWTSQHENHAQAGLHRRLPRWPGNFDDMATRRFRATTQRSIPKMRYLQAVVVTHRPASLLESQGGPPICRWRIRHVSN